MANSYSLDLASASNQWAVAADSATLSITGSLTLQCWVKRKSIGAVMTLMSKWNTSGNQRSYEFRFLADNTLQFRTSPDGSASTNVATSDTITDTSNWHHVAVSYNAGAGTCQFVIDGVNSQSASGLDTSLFDSTARFGLGGEDAGVDTPTNPANIIVDEARVYNTNRSTASIAADYQQEISSFTNVKAYYQLNNDYLDASGNSNTLTAKNSPTFSTDLPFGGTSNSGAFFAVL